MLIGEKYQITTDKMDVTLWQKQESKGKARQSNRFKAVGYYGTIQSALKALVDLEVRETGLKDLQTVVAKQEELYVLIEGLEVE